MKKAILVVVVLTLFSLCSTDAQTRRQLAADGRREYIEVERHVRLHVTDIGEGQPIVLIHGWPLSDAMYEYQYQRLADSGYRVIGITMRGFGKSDKPGGRYDYDVFADDIKTVLDTLQVSGVTLGGFSMGGAISVRYMSKYNGARVKKLVLFGAAVPVWTQRDDFPIGITTADANALIAQAQKDRPKLYEGFGKTFAASESSLSPGIAGWLGDVGMEASPYAVVQCLIALRDADLRSDLTKINAPVAIFHGVLDKICDFKLAEEMRARLKNSKVVKFEHSGHGLFIEELEKFNAELINFARQ